MPIDDDNDIDLDFEDDMVGDELDEFEASDDEAEEDEGDSDDDSPESSETDITAGLALLRELNVATNKQLKQIQRELLGTVLGAFNDQVTMGHLLALIKRRQDGNLPADVGAQSVEYIDLIENLTMQEFAEIVLRQKAASAATAQAIIDAQPDEGEEAEEEPESKAKPKKKRAKKASKKTEKAEAKPKKKRAKKASKKITVSVTAVDDDSDTSGVVAALQDLDTGEGATKAALREKMGIENDELDPLLKDAMESGAVTRTGKGRGVKYHVA